MRSAILSLCIVIASAVFALGLAIPDFSGTWIRDASRSDAMATNIGGKIQTVSADLVVRHEGNSLQVESRWGHKPATQANYVLGGNENTVTDERGNPFTYRATWNNDRLVIEGYTKASTPFGTAEIKTKAEWFLSTDGRTLTITTTTANSSLGNPTRKQVYTKQM